MTERTRRWWEPRGKSWSGRRTFTSIAIKIGAWILAAVLPRGTELLSFWLTKRQAFGPRNLAIASAAFYVSAANIWSVILRTHKFHWECLDMFSTLDWGLRPGHEPQVEGAPTHHVVKWDQRDRQGFSGCETDLFSSSLHRLSQLWLSPIGFQEFLDCRSQSLASQGLLSSVWKSRLNHRHHHYIN